MAFSFFFTAECMIKLIGFEFEAWKRELFNIFDLIIVISSNIELLIPKNQAGGAITALRATRLIRIIKLARSNVTLRCLLDSIGHTVKAIGNFMVILMIFIYVFSLLGMDMFAGTFLFDSKGNVDKVNGTVPRMNFDTITWAFITVF